MEPAPRGGAETGLPWAQPRNNGGGGTPSGISLSETFCVSQRLTPRTDVDFDLLRGADPGCASAACPYCNSAQPQRTEISDAAEGVWGVHSVSDLKVCWCKSVCVWSARDSSEDTLVLLASSRSSHVFALTLSLRIAARGNAAAKIAATQVWCELDPAQEQQSVCVSVYATKDDASAHKMYLRVKEVGSDAVPKTAALQWKTDGADVCVPTEQLCDVVSGRFHGTQAPPHPRLQDLFHVHRGVAYSGLLPLWSNLEQPQLTQVPSLFGLCLWYNDVAPAAPSPPLPGADGSGAMKRHLFSHERREQETLYKHMHMSGDANDGNRFCGRMTLTYSLPVDGTEQPYFRFAAFCSSCMTSPSDVPPPGITCTCTESKTDTRMLSSMCDVFVGNAYNAVKKFREAKTAAGAGGEEASGAEDGASATALITSNSHQRRVPPLLDYTSRNISDVLDAVLSTTCGLHSSHLSEIVKGGYPARTLCGLVNVYLSFSARLPADTHTAGQPTDTSPDTARVPWWCEPLFEGGRCAQPAATEDGACARVVRTWSKTLDIIHCLEVLYRALAYYTGPLAARALLAPDSTNAEAAFAALQRTWVHTVAAIKSNADSKQQQDQAPVCPMVKEQLKDVLVGPRCANCSTWAWWRPACHSTCRGCSVPVTVTHGALLLPPLSLHRAGKE